MRFFTFTIILLIASTNGIFAQTSPKITKKLSSYLSQTDKSVVHAWVFFTDKGDHLKNKLDNVAATLPDHSYFRRRKLIKTGDIIDFKDIPVEENYTVAITKSVKKMRKKSRWLNAISVEATAEQINTISKFSFVRKIDLVRTIGSFKDIDAIQNNISLRDTDDYIIDYGASLTQLEQINVPAAHDLGFTGEGVIICMLDAGFNNLEHPSLSQIDTLGSWDFVNDDWNVDDEDDMGSGSHGSKTLSTIGGYAEGKLIGPAFGAKYILAKTENTDSETQVEEDNWIAAVEWAEFNYGPDITSTSLGYIGYDDGTGYSRDELDGNTAPITIAADIAAGKGILVVNSAGNSGFSSLGAPADGDSVLAVGAVNAVGNVSSFSSRGPTGDGRIKPDVMAMGVSVRFASSNDSTYSNGNGTSFACPLTAGTAALLMEMVPEASNMDIFEALKMSADNAATPNNDYGWGIINLMAARDYLGLPRILHTPLTYTENMTNDYSIFVNIRSIAPLKEDSLFLFYRVDGEEWQQELLQNQTADLYLQQIAASGNPSTYEYYFTAVSETGSKRLPEDENTYFSFSTAVDIIAPLVEHSQISEYYAKLWGQATVKAEITDNLGVDTANVFVEWSRNGIAMPIFKLTNISGDHFEGIFPYQAVQSGDVMEYSITAHDIANTSNSFTTPTISFQITDRISFEQNTFSHNWVFTGSDNWVITDSLSQDGDQCLRVGIIPYSGNANITLTFESETPDTVSFYRKNNVISGSYYFFSIDYQNKTYLTMDTSDWTLDTFYVAPGIHRLNWGFAQYAEVPDSVVNTVWLDNITLPEQKAIVIIVVDIDKMVIQDYLFDISPNPAKEFITIKPKSQQTEYQLYIYDSTGKIVADYPHLKGNKNIDINQQLSGTYFVRFVSEGKMFNKKLIIVR